MENSRIKTSFNGLTIIHPYSGKVNRSVVSRIVKHAAKGYGGQSDAMNAERLINYGENVIILKDENGKISLDHTAVK